MKIFFYGYFEEKVKKHEGVFDLDKVTIKDTYHILKNKYDFGLELKDVMFSVNGVYKSDINTILYNQDDVALLPPMSGG